MTDETAKTRTEPAEPAATTRRAVFAGAGAVGAAAVLAACGTDPGEDPYTGEPAGAAEPPPAPQQSQPPASEAPPAEDGDAAAGLAQTGDVQVGGGVVLGDQDVVVTQPVAGEWKGFSATCTHEGCTVTDVSDGTINCNCHGSKFSIADGSVVGGPAPRPLEEKPVAVDGDWVVLA